MFPFSARQVNFIYQLFTKAWFQLGFRRLAFIQTIQYVGKTTVASSDFLKQPRQSCEDDRLRLLFQKERIRHSEAELKSCTAILPGGLEPNNQKVHQFPSGHEVENSVLLS